MARPPHAREKVLDAFESLLIDDGERAATMDATARAAGVSKGGLLYHFGSKSAMEEALVERMDRLVIEDLDAMAASAGGVVDAFIRSSATINSPLDRAIVSVGRLATSGSPTAAEALRRLRESWRAFLAPHVPDDTALTLVMLVADGVYFNQALEIGSVAEIADMDALITLVRRLADGTGGPPQS